MQPGGGSVLRGAGGWDKTKSSTNRHTNMTVRSSLKVSTEQCVIKLHDGIRGGFLEEVV